MTNHIWRRRSNIRWRLGYGEKWSITSPLLRIRTSSGTEFVCRKNIHCENIMREQYCMALGRYVWWYRRAGFSYAPSNAHTLYFHIGIWNAGVARPIRRTPPSRMYCVGISYRLVAPNKASLDLTHFNLSTWYRPLARQVNPIKVVWCNIVAINSNWQIFPKAEFRVASNSVLFLPINSWPSRHHRALLWGGTNGAFPKLRFVVSNNISTSNHIENGNSPGTNQ